ncbi:MAG: GlsB/YeaQ/YmgE family stress response membrane protein [Bacteroidetes bacterium]|nr:GlsB/YeaQ/YmgE family stress response membrane protein [Bacteroidota bacterium]
MTTFIGTIIAGAIIGWVASIIAKTSDQMGCLWNILIGIIGAALGGWLAGHLGIHVDETGFNLTRFLVGVGGAVLLIIVLRMVGILRRNR